MMMGLIGGAVALLLLAGILLAVKRRKAADSADPAASENAFVSAEPLRRRAVGGALLSGSTPEGAPAEEAVLGELAVEPRRKVAIGLTPWEGNESAAATPDEAADEMLVPEDEATPLETEQVDGNVPPPFESGGSPVVLDEAPPAHSGDDEPPSILAQLKTKKKTAPNALSGAAEGAPASAPIGPSEIEETVSLVLRRQVPPRLDEAPRSWLGGLPMMPDHVEWPRSVSPERLDEGEVPLNFVAQIACADFPDDLWAGLGPRTGWLLLFVNPRDSQGDDPRVFRLVHIDELGPERQPPAEIRPVESEEFAGGDYLWCRNADETPATWRRWPIDLVEVPNQAHDDGYRIVVTPKDYARALYAGAEVATGKARAAGETPFSWRGALYVVDSILRRLALPIVAQGVGPALREALDRPGYVASIIPELRAREADWLGEGEGAILSREEPLREREHELRERIRPVAEQRQQSLDRLAAFIVENPTGAAIAKRVEADNSDEAEWRSAAVDRIEAIREQILGQPLDSPLDAADWAALRDDLDAQRLSRWTVEWASRNSDFPVMIVEQGGSLIDLADAGIEAAVVELAADYQADPALSGLVPTTLLARLEPHWRGLTDNRPHRIGGFHDGLQSEPEDGPQAEVLLFQLASDEAMHWMWGDGGAYFVTISPRDLAAGRFDQAEIRLEQP